MILGLALTEQAILNTVHTYGRLPAKLLHELVPVRNLYKDRDKRIEEINYYSTQLCGRRELFCDITGPEDDDKIYYAYQKQETNYDLLDAVWVAKDLINVLFDPTLCCPLANEGIDAPFIFHYIKRTPGADELDCVNYYIVPLDNGNADSTSLVLLAEERLRRLIPEESYKKFKIIFMTHSQLAAQECPQTSYFESVVAVLEETLSLTDVPRVILVQ